MVSHKAQVVLAALQNGIRVHHGGDVYAMEDGRLYIVGRQYKAGEPITPGGGTEKLLPVDLSIHDFIRWAESFPDVQVGYLFVQLGDKPVGHLIPRKFIHVILQEHYRDNERQLRESAPDDRKTLRIRSSEILTVAALLGFKEEEIK